MDKRDRFEELFQERLQDWECQPDTEQWKTLAGFLPERPMRTFPQSISRIAAIITLLLVIGGTLLFRQSAEETIPELAQTEIQAFGKEEFLSPKIAGQIQTSNLPNLPFSFRETIQYGKNKFKKDSMNDIHHSHLPILISSEAITTIPSLTLAVSSQSKELLAHKPRQRKWHLGMGGGNFNVAGISTNTSGYPEYVYNNDFHEPKPDEPLVTKSQTASARSLLSELKPDKVKHSSPISFGISVSRSLTDRWSFNTGLTYSYLRNQWRYEGSQHDVLRQRLHMLGIPASFSYRLTNWERFYCYCSAGITCELNLTGKIYSAYKSQRQRIRGTLWTANTRIGIAYPVIRYISVYAEGGFLWNLTPASEIQTIRSDHFFNVTGQIGFRLNF